MEPTSESTTQGAKPGEPGRMPQIDGSVLVNGESLQGPLPCTVTALLARLELAGKRVAVSINRGVVPRSRHGEALVHAGDRVEILEAVGGG